MNIQQEYERTKDIYNAWLELYQSSEKLKSYAKKHFNQPTEVIKKKKIEIKDHIDTNMAKRVVKENLSKAENNLSILSNLEKLRRNEQAFLSKHRGQIVASCETMNTTRRVRVYNYGFGVIYYAKDRMCVEMNKKHYLFTEEKDFDFIFTLFKKRKETKEDIMEEVEAPEL